MPFLLLGASSGVGEELANLIINKKFCDKLILSSSSIQDKTSKINNISIDYINCDLSKKNSINNLIKILIDKKIFLQKIVISSGINQNKKYNYEDNNYLYNVNVLGIIHLINCLLEKEIILNSSQIICISSLASIRGRSSNYYYSGSKSALNHFLSGKRMELNSKKIRISTVILGPTRTKLLSKENKLKVISISKEKAARSIYKLLYNHKDIVYVPKFSLIIKLILSLVPEYIFKRFNF